MRTALVGILVAMCFAALAADERNSVSDKPFAQEYREFHVNAEQEEANDVRAIAVDGAGCVWMATKGGIFGLTKEGRWSQEMGEAEKGPAFAAETAPDGTVWLGAWNGLYHTSLKGGMKRVAAEGQPVGAIGVSGDVVVAMGPQGMWHNREGEWKHETGAWANSIRAVVCGEDGALWLPTAHGLFHVNGAEVVARYHKEADIRTGETSSALIGPEGTLWIGGNGGIDLFEDGRRVGSLTPEEGLPHSEVHSLDLAPDGVVWVGTACGVARYDGRTWSLRHSQRWLPDDDVRGVAFGPDGTAWVATANGVSAIKQRMMTLAEKAAYFHDIVMARKIRKPGLVEKSRLLTPGDVSTWSSEDDDNDGEYTNHYMVMEAFRYAATKNPQAKANAQKAFDAITFLQEVTGTSGFIARTVAPIEWTHEDNPNPYRFHDRNRTYTPQEIAEISVRDPRYKPVEVRWRPSADGKWLWKGDTSSDEVTGHFFGFLFYYELIAETDEEKARVRDLARRVMDYLIEGGLDFRDTDGKATRWGVWSPEQLNGNPDWAAERPVNATEMLSYLLTTYHITGDEKYHTWYRRLIDEHGYAEWARHPKPTDPSERTHIDSSLLMLTLPAFFICEKDPDMLAVYEEGLNQWFGTIKHEYSPMYSFVCGAFGKMDIGVEKCVEFLRDAPLDLIRWTVDNTKREDVGLVRLPEVDHWQLDRMVPPSERCVMRWDKNPWDAVRGDAGRTESSGVYWLLPYWMGRYYGFIGAAE